MSTERVDLPPRLSEQQQFVLAVLADLSTNTLLDGVYHQHLSWGVAAAYHSDDRPRCDGTTAAERAVIASSIPLGEYGVRGRTWRADVRGSPLEDRERPTERPRRVPRRRWWSVRCPPRNSRLIASHRATFSRLISALTDRRLVVESAAGELHPTNEGKEAGQELRRRNDDGRFGTSFPATPWDDDGATFTRRR